MTPERLEYLLNEMVLRGECADISREELYEALRALAKPHVLGERPMTDDDKRARRSEPVSDEYLFDLLRQGTSSKEVRAGEDLNPLCRVAHELLTWRGRIPA